LTARTVSFSREELELLASLAADQLFRREFIDPKMPGHKAVPGEISLGKELVARLRAAADPARPGRTPAPGRTARPARG
jgi:hypothetical protein